tara:strand:+ start:530 stop:709 length:180 start_codon:yes stop_codon:yes gene_type:complete
MNKAKKTLEDRVDEERLREAGVTPEIINKINTYYNEITELKCTLDYKIKKILEKNNELD